MNGDGFAGSRGANGGGTYLVYFNTGREFDGGSVSWSGVDTSTGQHRWLGRLASLGRLRLQNYVSMDMDWPTDLVDRVQGAITRAAVRVIEVQLNSGPYSRFC